MTWRAATPLDSGVSHHDGKRAVQVWRARLRDRAPAGAIDKYVRLQNPPKLWPSTDHCEQGPSPGSRACRRASASETIDSALRSADHVLLHNSDSSLSHEQRVSCALLTRPLTLARCIVDVRRRFLGPGQVLSV